MPALFTSTSSPPSAATPATIIRSTSARFPTSHVAVRTPGSSRSSSESALVSTSHEYRGAALVERAGDLTANARRRGGDQDTLGHGFSYWWVGVTACCRLGTSRGPR